MHDHDGVLNIDLLPPWKPSSILGRLRSTIHQSETARAAVAYWTVNGKSVSAELPDRLKGPQGFVAVDLHLPTDVDELASLVRDGANVYLYCEKIKGGHPASPHLLHTKLLLFETEPGTAELWVGSHNWTQRALGGLNMEATLVVKVKTESALYHDGLHYLEKIRSICEPFDLAKVDYYKRLQGEQTDPEEPELSVELYGKAASALENTTIAIFGTDERDMKHVRSLKPIRVTVFDVEDSTQHNYSGTILHNGPLERFTPAAAGLSLTRRKYAVRRERTIPVLSDIEDIPPSVMSTSKYFVSISIETPQPEVIALDLPMRVSMWHSDPADSSPLVSRMNPEDRRFVFGERAPRVAHPGSPEETLPQVANLADRLASEERPLLIRKLFRRTQEVKS